MILPVDSVGSFDAFFQDATGLGVAGLTVTVDIYDPAGVQAVTNAAATALGGGLYTYAYTLATAGTWRAIFKTTGTVIQKHLACELIASAALGDLLEHVDTLEDGQASILAAIGTIAPPSGSFVLAVSTAPSARIDVRANLSGALIYTYQTDGNGDAVMLLDAGTYDIYGILPGYSITPEIGYVVSASGSLALAYTQLNPSAPVAPELCRLYVYLNLPDGTPPIAGLLDRARLTLSGEPTVSPVDYYNRGVPGVYDATTGLLYWDAPRGGVADISAPGFFNLTAIAVPDAANYDLRQDI